MVPISHPVRRSVVTTGAGSIDATLTGNGGTPIAAADIVGGLSTKTIAFAAGETLKYATWDIVDDAAVEGTEGYKVTLSNPQPNGTISVPSITGTVLDNDTSGGGGGGGGSGALYGPKTAKDTGPVELPATGGTLTTSLNDDEIWSVTLGDQDGTPAYRIQHAGVNGRISAVVIAADGTTSPDGGLNYLAVPGFANTAAKFVVSSTQIAIFIGDMNTPVATPGRPNAAAGNFIRHQVAGNGAAVSTTVTGA